MKMLQTDRVRVVERGHVSFRKLPVTRPLVIRLYDNRTLPHDGAPRGQRHVLQTVLYCFIIYKSQPVKC